MLQLTVSGPVIVKDDEWGVQQQEFARRHCVVYKNFVDASILARVPRWCETSRWLVSEHFYRNTTEVFARELCMGRSEPLVQAFHLLLNQPRLFAAIPEFTGSEVPIRGFLGRCYKRLPGAGHFDSWHHDNVRVSERLYGLSINLSREPFAGGSFKIRSRETGEILRTVTSGFGDACLFRISKALDHRVSRVRGTRPRCCFAGWFSGTLDYREFSRNDAMPARHFHLRGG